jgi:hypothetical protein
MAIRKPSKERQRIIHRKRLTSAMKTIDKLFNGGINLENKSTGLVLLTFSLLDEDEESKGYVITNNIPRENLIPLL